MYPLLYSIAQQSSPAKLEEQATQVVLWRQSSFGILLSSLLSDTVSAMGIYSWQAFRIDSIILMSTIFSNSGKQLVRKPSRPVFFLKRNRGKKNSPWRPRKRSDSSEASSIGVDNLDCFSNSLLEFCKKCASQCSCPDREAHHS